MSLPSRGGSPEGGQRGNRRRLGTVVSCMRALAHWVACVGVGIGLAACAQHPPGRTPEQGTSPEKTTPAENGEVSSGTITASGEAVPEGRLVLQLNSGIEVLAQGDGRSLSLGGDGDRRLRPLSGREQRACRDVRDGANQLHTRGSALCHRPIDRGADCPRSGRTKGGPWPCGLVARWSTRCVSAHRPARRSGAGTSRGHGGADRVRRRRGDDDLAVLPGPRDSRWVRLVP